MNSVPPPDTSVSLPTLDYNIVQDMKKALANISLCELTKIKRQQEILLRELGKTFIGDVTSSRRG